MSWHADSTLDHFSTIGVYHCTSRHPCSASTSAAPCTTYAKGKGKDKSVLGKRDAPADALIVEEGGDETAAAEAEAEPCATATADAQVAAFEMDAQDEVQEEVPGEDLSWRLALRVWYDAEGPNATKAVTSRAGEMQTAGRLAPALAVPLPSGSCYFLLDDFNHHHQHSVLAGNTYRYASTHRVCKTEGHTFQSVCAKANRLLQV